ncbi:Pseudouridine synthase [Candidatus Zixiibacteriota bacterium]|nr:Pseudouridine synthase [candidate division Zixibacteria bacterium]
MTGNDTRQPPQKTVEISCPPNIKRERLDRYLGRDSKIGLSRSKIQKLIESGLVTVDGRPAEHSHILNGGEKIKIQIPPAVNPGINPEEIPLNVIFEDEFLLVVNKPAGMVTHPAAGHRSGTLVNALLNYSSDLSRGQGLERAGIVHRLDKNTSGLIIAAKNDTVHQLLQNAFQKREIKKKYWALVCGHMKKDSDTIDRPVGRSRKDRKKMTVTDLKGRRALTGYRLLERYKLYDLLEIDLLTGRTHQIRVHLSHLGHPVFGDPEYGGRQKWHRGIYSADHRLAEKALDLIPRQALHAKSLVFRHPVTGRTISLDSALPEDFQNLLNFLTESFR